MINLTELHKLTAEISARLVRSSSESLDADITQSLAEVIPMLKADRGGLISVKKASPIAHVAYAWYAEKAPKVSNDINLVEQFPWAYQSLVLRQRTLSISRLADLPPEAGADRRSYEASGTKSFLSIPLLIGQRVHHILVLNALKTERSWPEEIIAQVQLIGEIFVSALQRREAELILKDANDRLELAARSAGCGMWELDPCTGMFWVTPKVRDHFGFEPDQPVTMKEVMARIDPEDHALVLAQIEEARRTEKKRFFDV